MPVPQNALPLRDQRMHVDDAIESDDGKEREGKKKTNLLTAPTLPWPSND